MMWGGAIQPRINGGFVQFILRGGSKTSVLICDIIAIRPTLKYQDRPCLNLSTTFLPTIASIIISVLVRIVHANSRVFQPWHELATPSGAKGSESPCCSTSGWHSIIASIRSLRTAQPVLFLTTLSSLRSTLLIPLSTEAVEFQLEGCTTGSAGGSKCLPILSVFTQPLKATRTLLSLMALVVALLVLYQMRLTTGFQFHPWSIKGVASLSRNTELMDLVARMHSSATPRVSLQKLTRRIFSNGCFQSDYYYDEKSGKLCYGIILLTNQAANAVDNDVQPDATEATDSYQLERTDY